MSEATWVKRPAIEGTFGGCLCCGPRPSLFPADGVIAVGFGYAALHRDGEVFWDEMSAEEGKQQCCDGFVPIGEKCSRCGCVAEWDFMTGAQAEAIAAADPDHDWQIVLHGPLSGRTYQRHCVNEWVLVEQDLGFA